MPNEPSRKPDEGDELRNLRDFVVVVYGQLCALKVDVEALLAVVQDHGIPQAEINAARGIVQRAFNEPAGTHAAAVHDLYRNLLERPEGARQ